MLVVFLDMILSVVFVVVMLFGVNFWMIHKGSFVVLAHKGPSV